MLGDKNQQTERSQQDDASSFVVRRKGTILLASLVLLVLLCLFQTSGSSIRISDLKTVRSVMVETVAARERNLACTELPITLGVGIGGPNCTARAASIDRLRTMLLSLEYFGSKNVSVLLWLEPSDNTSQLLLDEICRNLTCSITPMNVGDVAERTSLLSPPLTESYIYRKYDFVKFWGIHDAATSGKRYLLNVDLDVIFLRPIVEVWEEGCRKVSQGASFYVAGQEALSEINHPG